MRLNVLLDQEHLIPLLGGQVDEVAQVVLGGLISDGGSRNGWLWVQRLGAVVVLITWFYVTALLLLLGAELAAVKGRGNDVSPSKAS